MFNPFSILAISFYPKEYKILKTKLLHIYYTTISFAKTDHTEILNKLLISGEDHRFKYHLGFDLIAIVRAIRNRTFYKKIEGASTIEQQLVRVLTNDFKRSLKRKIKEIFLATTLRYIIPRKAIPLIYLQVAYYGTNMIGLNAVLKKLKVESTDPLTEEIAAEIVARIKYPEPQKTNETRLQQIEMRKKHLLFLYNKHSSYKRFKIYG